MSDFHTHQILQAVCSNEVQPYAGFWYYYYFSLTMQIPLHMWPIIAREQRYLIICVRQRYQTNAQHASADSGLGHPGFLIFRFPSTNLGVYVQWTLSNLDTWSEVSSVFRPFGKSSHEMRPSPLIRTLWLVPRVTGLEGVHCTNQDTLIGPKDDRIRGSPLY